MTLIDDGMLVTVGIQMVKHYELFLRSVIKKIAPFLLGKGACINQKMGRDELLRRLAHFGVQVSRD